MSSITLPIKCGGHSDMLVQAQTEPVRRAPSRRPAERPSIRAGAVTRRPIDRVFRFSPSYLIVLTTRSLFRIVLVVLSMTHSQGPRSATSGALGACELPALEPTAGGILPNAM